MKDHFKYQILLNCILIQENFRECFLIWGKKSLNIPNLIKTNFPNLILNDCITFAKNHKLEHNDVILVSKRIVESCEYDTDIKLGKLLGYLSANNFNDLDYTKPMYNYSLKVIMNDNIIHIYDEYSKNKLNYNIIKEKAESILYQNNFGFQINNVFIDERKIMQRIKN